MAGFTEPNPDFSQPWRMSDVVLLVDGERLHVHQGILAMWSPVFEKLFSDLKKNNSRVLTLEGLKPQDLRELLLFIYPTISRPVNEANCYCLLELAMKFQMDKVTEECEEYLMNTLRAGSEVIDVLVLAAKYNVIRLRDECLRRAKLLDWGVIQKHELYEQIALPDYRAIVEQRLKTLQIELEDEKQRVQSLEDEIASLLPRGTPASTSPSLFRRGAPASTSSPSLLPRATPASTSPSSSVVNTGLASPRMQQKFTPRPASPTKHLQVTLSTAANTTKAAPLPATKPPPPVPKRAFHPVKPQPIIKEF